MKVDIVLLRPNLEVMLERNRTRTIGTVDETVLRILHEMLGNDYTRRWGHYDNTERTANDEAHAIISMLELDATGK